MSSKMEILALILIIGVSNLDGAALDFRCDYTHNGSGWFKYHSESLTWHDARRLCLSEGGVLASPETDDIKATMMSHIETVIFVGYYAQTVQTTRYYSVDGTEIENSSCKYAKFGDDSLNNTSSVTESCVSMDLTGKLSMASCKEPRPFICYRADITVTVNDCGTTDPEYHYKEQTGKCYKLHTKRQAFAEARSTCQAEGGDLTVINGPNETKALQEIYDLYPEDQLFKSTGYVHTDFAIVGFLQSEKSGWNWVSVDGQPIKDAGFPDFAEHQPDNSNNNEHCGALFRKGNLNDVNCDTRYYFICEKNPEYTTNCSKMPKTASISAQ
ncbi:macrophage mannose receptor 1-like [Anticarsia gemmatalis]|uniref:macrophage mannose receptor 1-like n=1 Tax=Anticarsia gemmatalis TaxID=129554 RepID=UPI003F774789